jgi:hypothetical protein
MRSRALFPSAMIVAIPSVAIIARLRFVSNPRTNKLRVI